MIGVGADLSFLTLSIGGLSEVVEPLLTLQRFSSYVDQFFCRLRVARPFGRGRARERPYKAFLPKRVQPRPLS